MSSLTTTWSPSSFQLRLAFTGRKSPSVVLFHTRFRKLDWRIRLFSVSENISVRNYGSERRPSGDSWAVNSNSAADGFAGWTNGEQSSDSHAKPSLKGIAGAGVAGVVLVAGLTFAALSLGKRNTSRVKQQMEALTTQQELQLASEENINESKSETQEDIDKDVSSSTENTEVTESRNDMGDTSNVDDAPNVTPLQQDAQNESSNDDTLVDPEESPKPPEAEISAGSFTASSSENNSVNINPQQLEPLSEVTPQQENLVTNSSLLDNNMTNVSTNDQEGTSAIETTENPNYSPKSSQSESTTLNISLNPQLGGVLEPRTVHDIAMVTRSSPATEDVDLNNAQEVSAEGDKSSPALLNRTVIESFGARLMSDVAYPFANEQLGNAYQTVTQSRSPFDLKGLGITFTSSGTPAPSNVSTALQEVPGKVLVPAVVDHVQGQALAALQALKVIEADVQPGDLCTRREYARWLVSASSALSRSSVSKVYPAMYIENVTELAFDDITAEDPDFPSIQGLAEAGLISSKLSRRDMQCSVDDDPCPVLFAPESPLSRQDLVSWKMALEKKQLPVVDRKTLQQLSGFIDIQRINPDAWPALVADLAAGEQGIIALSFGYTRLFQPDKPVTKAQAAIALATGEASEIVSEELARIEAETMAEKVVASQSALVAQFEQDVNASYEKELQLEREKIGVVEKLAVEARQELEKLRAQREEENFALMKERAAVDSEMEVLSRLRSEVEEQLHILLSNKVEISYEKERISKLRTDAEAENQEITRLHYELEVERKALSMARAWAEDEAKRAREQAKSLEEARERWERQGIKVVVDDDLREEANAGVTWVAAGKEFSEGTVDRAENLVDRLKAMADVVRGKSRDTIQKIVQMVLSVVHSLKELILKAGRQGEELKDTTIAKLGSSVQEAQQSSVQFTSGVKEGIKRVAGDCREGIEKITQRFKT